MNLAKLSQTVHDPSQLTNLSVEYQVDLQEMISIRNPAKIMVRKSTDKFYVWDRGDLYRIVAGEFAPGTETKSGKNKLGTQTYTVEPIGLHEDTTAEEVADEDEVLDVVEQDMEYITSNCFLRDEKKLFSIVYKTDVWTGSTTGTDLVGGTDFDQFNVAGADTVKTVDKLRTAMRRKTGKLPNTIIVDADTHDELKNSEELKDRVKYVMKGFLTEELLAEAFGVKNYWVAYSTENDAAIGAEDNFQFIATKDTMWIGYLEGKPGKKKPSAWYSFYWTEPMKVAKSAYRLKLGLGMRSFYIETLDVIRTEGKLFSGHHITAPDLGMFLTNTIDRS